MEAAAPGQAALTISLGYVLLTIVYIGAGAWSWGHAPSALHFGEAVACASVAYLAYSVACGEYISAFDAIRSMILNASSVSGPSPAGAAAATPMAVDTLAKLWRFEKIWGAIYRSQIALLEYLNSVPQNHASVDEVRDRFYAPVASHDLSLAAYPFVDYLNFLISLGLVQQSPAVSTAVGDARPTVTLTPLGREFLAYMVSQGYAKEMRIH